MADDTELLDTASTLDTLSLKTRDVPLDLYVDIAQPLSTLLSTTGEREEALTWLERAVELGNENFPWFERDPNWASLREDPEYRALFEGG